MAVPAREEDVQQSRPTRAMKLLHLQPKKGAWKTPGSSYIALFRPLQDVQSRLILVAGILFAIAAGVPLPVIGVIFSKIINSFPPSASEIHSRVTELLGVAVAYFVVTFGWAFCWGLVGARVSRGLRMQMVERALGLDQTYYETQCPDITSRLTVDAQTVQSGTAEKVGIFIQSLSYFVTAFIVGFILNARLTGILFAAVVPSIALVAITGTTVINRYSKDASESTTLASSIAEGAIRAVQVVQAFDAFEPLTVSHRNHLKTAMSFGIRKSIAGAVLLGSIFFIAYSANSLAFWEGARIVENSSSGSAGTVYAIVFLILDASFVIASAGPFIQSFAQAATAGRRIFNLIDYPDIPIDVYSDHGVKADETTFRPGNDIVFKDVSFAYPARADETVLDSVSLTLRIGSSIGIVGSSGSGKSTIASLLLRMYDPAKGSVSVGAHSIPEFNLASLRDQIALVDQDPVLFSGTVYTNIKYGYKGSPISEDEMRRKCELAARDADAWTFIQSLPDGLDTWLGEPSGTKLSGGQKQRLCLARALVGDPALLVLDEATSALDTISEASILASLGRSRSGDRTTIMIAHRLASIKEADHIIVMGKGKVLEEGNHQTLMESNGSYRQLIEAQTFEQDDRKTSEADEEAPSAMTKALTEIIEVSREDTPAPLSLEKSPVLGTGTIIRRCLSLSRSRLVLTLCALLGSLITGALIIGESIIFGHLVQTLNAVPISIGQVDFYSLMFFVVAIAAFIGYITSGSCFGTVSEHLVFRVRDISLCTVLRQDMEWFLQSGRSTASLVSVINMDSGHISGLSGVIIGTIVSALVSVVGGAILAHIVAWKIAIVLFATSPVIVLSGFFRLRILAKVEENNSKAYTEAASLATEACTAIRTIAALGTEKVTLERFREAIKKNQKKTTNDTAFGNVILAFALSITYFVYSLAYWWGSKLVRQGEYSSLDFFIVLPAILFSAQAAGQIFSLAPDIGRAKGAASRVFNLHDQKPTIDTRLPQDTQLDRLKESESSLEMSYSSGRASPSGSITFKDVGLVYQSRPDNPVFTNFNLKIKAGETVALVGRSGAGKTSIISLIERFYDPTAGSILLDNVDIKSVPVSQHRARISLVSQDPDLFSGTVAFNVGLGARPGHAATREEVIDACKAVGIHEFVSGLPDGYETQCGINGSQLSGGQKQRVAIARAYIRDPEILLLDEATSALDSHSEAQIQQAITAVSRKRTTIMVAHRLTSVQKADRILVFDKGRIMEEGKHQDLVKSGGIYEQMIKAHGLG